MVGVSAILLFCDTSSSLSACLAAKATDSTDLSNFTKKKDFLKIKIYLQNIKLVGGVARCRTVVGVGEDPSVRMDIVGEFILYNH